MALPANRTQEGRFAQGHSGNPTGRPKPPNAVREAQEHAANLTPKLIDQLYALAIGAKVKASDRIRAAEVVLRAGGALEHPMEVQHSGTVGLQFVNDWRDLPKSDQPPVEGSVRH